ncbi:hypothetical protein [Ignatzschineria cameli]|uniref:hypothetical protein n=1 Tax=Ignatzschineria cameli TaxID=2182793 RepID=UPI000D6076EC|nr:hypothetical protein [Ignatzschineria cameli]PWD87394.1 hypothetical protein DC080_00810 [Ignatzschineria cameli]
MTGEKIKQSLLSTLNTLSDSKNSPLQRHNDRQAHKEDKRDKEEMRAILRLSDTYFNHNEVDLGLAKRLPVYRYHLPKGQNHWRKWQDEKYPQISEGSSALQRKSLAPFPYLHKTFLEQNFLFIALDEAHERPPTLLGPDHKPLLVEPVLINPQFYPIWIRLLFRKSLADASHYGNFHTLGRPLLLLHHWKKASQPGIIQALAIDCATQQLNSPQNQQTITEISLFHHNVLLREVEFNMEQSGRERDRQFLRDYWAIKETRLTRASHEISATAPLYQEIAKNSRYRLTRPFIDLKSYENCRQSWPAILGPVQQRFIALAKQYGFQLSPKELKLMKLPTQTKARVNVSSKSSKNSKILIKPKSKSYSPSIPPLKKVALLDHRLCQNISTDAISHYLTKILQHLNIPTKFEIITSIKQLNHHLDHPTLVLIDQRADVVEDRYHLTNAFKGLLPIQHLNINPYDLLHKEEIFPTIDTHREQTIKSSAQPQSLSIDEAETQKKSANGSGEDIQFSPPEHYYQYQLEDLSLPAVKKSLEQNLDICLKELQIKSLLLDPRQKISTILPAQANILTEQLILISCGYLFTVEADRPILIPISDNNSDHQILLNHYLQPFGQTFASLLAQIYQKWPYHFPPEALDPDGGSSTEKFNARLRRLTILLHKMLHKKGDQQNEGINCMMLDPQYHRPHILFEEMDEILEILKQRSELTPRDWLIYKNDLTIISNILERLKKDPHFSSENAVKMLTLMEELLPQLLEIWNSNCRDFELRGITEELFDKIKRATFKTLFQRVKATTPELQKNQKFNSTFSTIWHQIASELFKIPLHDLRSQWLNHIPGMKQVWHDPDHGYYIVGSLLPLQLKIERQPTIRQWHKISGELDTALLCALIDVDWVRTNQLAGNPAPTLLIERWKELQADDKIWSTPLLPINRSEP